MPPKLIGFILISFFHNLFTVIWLGGMIVTLFAYSPAVKEALGAGPQMKKVMGAFKKKQRVWVWVSMAGLVITGLLMGNRNPAYGGLFSFNNPYSIALGVKHILVIAMIGIALYRSIVLVPKSPAMAQPAGGPGPGGKKPGGKAGQPGAGAMPKGQPGAAGGPPSAAAAKQAKLNLWLLVINVTLAVLVLLNSAVVTGLGASMTR